MFCFNTGMVDTVNNNNSHMKLPKRTLGVIEAPKNTVKTELYNEAEAKLKQKQLQQKIYEAKQQDTFEKRQKMPPAALIVIITALAAFGLYKLKAFTAIKNLFSRLKKN